MTVKDFSEFELSPEVQEAVRSEGYSEPTDIQARTIPPILAGRDVIGQAKTGTGKTAAFALPLLSRIDATALYPQVCVLAPTRELSIQVAEAFETYGRHFDDLRVATIYGGQSYGIQINQLKRGAQIVVGTPGRVIDHMKRGNLKLDQLRTFVLDEADEMLNMGFSEDVQWILAETRKDRQTLMFSATMPKNLRQIADQYLQDPLQISVQSDTMTTASVHQRVCVASPREKLGLLARILESEPSEGVIVFVKTKELSTRLAENLCQRGYKASALNGDMQQQQRERTVSRLKAGQLDILVATDVAARGLDVDRITHVVNYDFPHDTEAYVHRIGRTGRAGRDGHAILFVGPREKFKLRQLEKVTGQPMTWMEKPTREAIQANRASKLKIQLAKVIASEELTAHTEMINQFLSENPESSMGQVAAALAMIATKGNEVEEERFGGGPRERGQRARHAESGGRDGKRGREGRFGDRKFDKRGGHRSESRGVTGRMTKYRIEVGRAHGVRPGNIVGAIANESGLNGSQIGGIDIQTHFSTVDLPTDLPDELIQGLRQLRVAGQPLKISKWDRGGRNSRFEEKPRRFNRKKGGKPSWKKSGKPVAKAK